MLGEYTHTCVSQTYVFLPKIAAFTLFNYVAHLFVLCIDRFSLLISDSVQASRWKPIRVGSRGSPISHWLFADDLLLFDEASNDKIIEVSYVLDRFCRAFGQKVSASKTVVYFSKNISSSIKEHTIYHYYSMGKYNGILIVHAEFERVIFMM